MLSGLPLVPPTRLEQPIHFSAQEVTALASAPPRPIPAQEEGSSRIKGVGLPKRAASESCQGSHQSCHLDHPECQLSQL